MNKLNAIVRYELLMAWRRRSLPILWILLLVGVIFFIVLVEDANRRTPAMDQALEQQAAQGDLPEWMRGVNLEVMQNTIGLITVVIAGMVFFVVGVTLLMGEVIPLDRQFKVRELLDALPVSRATYLGGKLLSTWAGILIGIVGVGAICAVAIQLIFGVYDLRVFAALWLTMLLPMAFVAAALSVLASSFVGSRRGAVLVGLLVMPFVLTLAFVAVPSFGGVGALIDPIYSLGVLMMPGADTNAVIVERITNTLALLAGVVLAAWTFVWLNARVREAR